MTDWDLINEYIQHAMQPVDETHGAAENLRNQSTQEKPEPFSAQMEALSSRLSALQDLLKHETAYSMDELVDVLSKMGSGEPAAYRRTQHIDI